jgi:AcrR family transcriptional regulator
MVRPAQARRAPEPAEPGIGTRRRILDAARELFAQHGYAGTSIRLIARRCGLSDPAIHYHFRTKSEIYDALLVEPAYDVAPPRADTADRQSIARFMEHRFFWWARDVDFVRLLMREQLRGRPESLAYLAASERQYHEELSEPLRAIYGEAAGIVSDLGWNLLAGVLWDVLLSYGSDATEIMEQEFFRERIRRLIDLVLDAGERPTS